MRTYDIVNAGPKNRFIANGRSDRLRLCSKGDQRQ